MSDNCSPLLAISTVYTDVITCTALLALNMSDSYCPSLFKRVAHGKAASLTEDKTIQTEPHTPRPMISRQVIIEPICSFAFILSPIVLSGSQVRRVSKIHDRAKSVRDKSNSSHSSIITTCSTASPTVSHGVIAFTLVLYSSSMCLPLHIAPDHNQRNTITRAAKITQWPSLRHQLLQVQRFPSKTAFSMTFVGLT